jgi:hypothetical protein
MMMHLATVGVGVNGGPQVLCVRQMRRTRRKNHALPKIDHAHFRSAYDRGNRRPNKGDGGAKGAIPSRAKAVGRLSWRPGHSRDCRDGRPRHCTPVRLSCPARSCQFGRVSAPTIPQPVGQRREPGSRHRTRPHSAGLRGGIARTSRKASARPARACWRASSEGRGSGWVPSRAPMSLSWALLFIYEKGP